ncbi:TPA: hypothetical protein N0F65_012480 [Lagenidium giganteum]|uniref:Uncharacterized protein n=1 Tax=Lagenidium giganteum TaxID=4803 RepID=A0AAV2YSQ4_9STRA|nr:TPA: hypothetical protein N0F65_012480 [Lagenidium giganteum]
MNPQNVSTINEELISSTHGVCKLSIYENTRMSGENVHRGKLENYVAAESSDLCSDATDSMYAKSLMSLLSTSGSSRL